MFLFSAVAIGAAVVIRTEVLIADRFERSMEGAHAAEAALHAAIADLREMPDWTPVLAGGRRSALAQGGFHGTAAVPGGGTVLLCCGRGSIAERLAAETQASPVLARRSIAWQPFLWAPFDALAPRMPPSRFFTVVFVGQDEDEALASGPADANGLVLLRAEAVDPAGSRRSLEALLGRRPVMPPGPGAPPGGPGGPAGAGGPAAGGGGPPTAGGGPPGPAGTAAVAILSWREAR
jgi:hypothetical protein